MHIICFSNPQHHLNEVEEVMRQLVVDHTETVVIPPFTIPVNKGTTIKVVDPKNPTGQAMQFFFPQVLLFVFFKGDVPKIVEEIWAKQKEQIPQEKKKK